MLERTRKRVGYGGKEKWGDRKRGIRRGELGKYLP